ncbi:metalloendopeptidase [Trichonephila clavipes]|nr:metalloendopeptidase [Trichonephila clavipes]
MLWKLLVAVLTFFTKPFEGPVLSYDGTALGPQTWEDTVLAMKALHTEDDDMRFSPNFQKLSEFERGLIIGMKTVGWSTHRVADQRIVRSVPLEVVGSSGQEKVPTHGKPGLERPGRPRGERIEGSCGKHLWTPQ